MGSYFRVIEHRVGGNLGAFHYELRRIRESGHLYYARHGRMMRIAEAVGSDYAVCQCLVDTERLAGCEVHVLAGIGIVLVFNVHSGKLVTVLMTRPGRVARHYELFGEDVPD